MTTSWYIIFPLWVLFFPLSIYLVSEKIALCGIYHKTIPNSKLFDFQKTELGEPFLEKFVMILTANMYLSLPFIISYYIVIDNTLKNENNIVSKEIALLSFILTLVSLITIRFLANPPQFISSKIPKLYLQDAKDVKGKKIRKVQSMLNERIISFFHSFICAAIIILGILLSANITLGNDILINNPKMSYQIFGEMVAIYSFGLIFFTFLLEVILFRFPPITEIET